MSKCYNTDYAEITKQGTAAMILVIEDDENINGLLCSILKQNGYEVQSVLDGWEGYNKAMANEYSLILMDLMLPLKSGEEILRELRTKKNTPVIVLSAKGAVNNRIELLRLGADDFICKPFDIDEVILRIDAVLRRTEGTPPVLRFKDMKVDKESKRVFVCGSEIICTAMEYAILEMMLSNPNKIFSKRNLFESITGDEYMSDENTMNVHISNLRKKIAKVTEEHYIETVYGMGYRLAN